MSFKPDLMVLSRERPEVLLVAEVKRSMAELDGAVDQLKEYMRRTKCSLGLLVTQDVSRIYRDTFDDSTGDPIHLEGECSTSDLLSLDSVPTSDHELERELLAWLEQLARYYPNALPTETKARALVQFLVPDVVEGRVRRVGCVVPEAGVPRESPPVGNEMRFAV